MSIEDYKDLQSRSVYMQLNLLSLIGYYGVDIQKKASKLITQGLISFVGTDCHNMGHTNVYEKCQTSSSWHHLVGSGKLLNHIL